MSIDEFVNSLRGTAGSIANVVFYRPSNPANYYQAKVRRSLIRYPTVKNEYGFVAVYRDINGKYFYIRNDHDTYFELPLGAVQSLDWNVGGATVQIKFARPTTNADRHDRELDYSFFIK